MVNANQPAHSSEDDENDQFVLLLSDDDVAGLFATSLMAPKEWAHRRVETISFHGADEVRHRVSVDFTAVDFLARVPGVANQVLVPLAYLKKRPITSLDVRDSSGSAVPVLSTGQNGSLATRALLSMALAYVNSPVERIAGAIEEVVFAAPDDAPSLLEGLRAQIKAFAPDDPLRGLLDYPFLEIVEEFTENFVLVVLLTLVENERTVVKFSYLEPLASSEDSRGWWEVARDGLGLTHYTLRFAVPGAELAWSYHVEVESPAGMAIAQAEVTSTSGPVIAPQTRAGQTAVHLHARRGSGSDSQVTVNVRAARDGWLRASGAVSTVVLVLLAFVAWRLPALSPATGQSAGTGPQRPSVDVAALLLALVALLAAVVMRRADHPLTSRIIAPLRALATVAVTLPVIVAVLLGFGPDPGDFPTYVRWGPPIAALLVTGALYRAYRGPKLVPE